MNVSDTASLDPEVLLPSSTSLTSTAYDVWNTSAKITALKIASYLTEPVCKVREYFYTFYILNKICKTTTQKILTIAYLTLGIFTFSLLTPLTAPVGAFMRGLVTIFESQPYTYIKREGEGKLFPENKKITLASHNVCYMPAGYCITDGQVVPPSDRRRINANILKIKELNPDIVCLYEVSDIYDAQYISSQLPEYPFLIPVAGVRAIGPSSMMYVASKYEIIEDSIEFVPFIKGTELTGWAQYSEKGILSFDIRNQKEQEQAPIATIILTHLQHSEIPEQPEEDDVRARTAQMKKIAEKIQAKMQDKAVIFTGDLNQVEEEINRFLTEYQISYLTRDLSIGKQTTWDGDQWCSDLTGKQSSGPLVLDYTFIAGKAASNISTKIIETGYSGKEFRSEATSDHKLLFSTITLS